MRNSPLANPVHPAGRHKCEAGLAARLPEERLAEQFELKETVMELAGGHVVSTRQGEIRIAGVTG
jgi:hypothetical protein